MMMPSVIRSTVLMIYVRLSRSCRLPVYTVVRTPMITAAMTFDVEEH